MGHVFKKRNSWITLWVLTFSLPVTNQSYPQEEILPSLCPVCSPSARCHSSWSFPATLSVPSQHQAEDAAVVPGIQVLSQLPKFGQVCLPWCLCTAKSMGISEIWNIPVGLSDPCYRSTQVLSKTNRICACTNSVSPCFHSTDRK